MRIGPYGFPAEDLLTESPPNYPNERWIVTIKIIVVFFFFIVVLPLMMVSPVVENDENENDAVDGKGMKEVKSTTTTTTTIISNTKTTMNGKTSTNGKRRSKKSSQSKVETIKSNKEKEKEAAAAAAKVENDGEVPMEVAVHPLAGFISSVGCIVFISLTILTQSPDNYYTPNGVFQAPLLTKDECQTILQMADDAASVNYQKAKSVEGMYNLIGAVGGGVKNDNDHDNEFDDDDDDGAANQTIMAFLQEPYGWNKIRHREYPTTDLNLVTDPFTKEHRDYIKDKLDARLSPIIQRIYGIPPASIRATDMFVVRYDEGVRTSLNKHTDDGSISINILLDDEFEGGGTRFWNRNTGEPFAHVEPTQVGQVLIHSALIQHEGIHITSGRRTIFVAFLEVDRVDPFIKNRDVMTGLSWWSSWGSVPWLRNKLKQGYHAALRRVGTDVDDWKNNQYISSFFGHSSEWLGDVGDVFYKRFVNKLIDDDDRDEFLSRLDNDYNNNNNNDGTANWFAGQQVDLDINGKVASYWSTRVEYGHRFDEL